MAGFVVYGAQGSGSVAVEAALTLIGAPYSVVEAAPWGDEAQQARLAQVSPLRQAPVLELPDGARMSESAAILVWLAETYPEARLGPAPGDPGRAAFLRWMTFVPANIYAMYTLGDEPSRWLDDETAQAALRAKATEKTLDYWRVMEAEVSPAPYILGSALSVLDLYATVVSRWRPGRETWAKACPKLAGAVARVDAEPRLEAFWAERFPPA